MLHAALLAAVLSSAPAAPNVPPKTPVQICFESMDGAVYHGDPTNRVLMQQNVVACRRGLVAVERLHASAAAGPQKLFIMARILDRTATLSYIGLDDAAAALADVRKANLYFRIASGLADASSEFHDAALANVTLTNVQLQTLTTDIATTAKPHARTVALRMQHAKHTEQ